jgi:UDP-3-O-[3-hydroxymyristoyl] glucosamine N-acyltransferase
MKPDHPIDLPKVLDALQRLGIPYRLEGGIRTIHKVCSLYLKEPNGLYYHAGTNADVFAGLTESVVICRQDALGDLHGNSAIVVESDPQLVTYKVCNALFGALPHTGIHPTAIIHPDAVIGEDVSIGPYSVIGRSTIGRGSHLAAHVVVGDGCTIGSRVIIEPHACIGATGIAWVWDEAGKRVVMPLLGGVSIGDDCFLATDVGVVRGMFNEDTTISEGTMIAPGSKVGHGVHIERICHLANNVTLAGWARIGERSFLGSGCTVRPHAKLAPGTIVGSGSVVTRDIIEPDCTVAGVPAKPLPNKEKSSGVPKRFTPRGV